jgi:transketolase
LRDKWVAFGWHVIEVDGHSVAQLMQAFDEARTVKGKPTFIIANTIKGRGLPHVADMVESHSVSFTKAQVESTLRSLGCSPGEIADAVAHTKEAH